ncbi:dnaJ homolog subfamily C member 10-like [Anneissia japonica]|uniref:dnaJ homolog subfamily C member 10-like n=1 Tax=Anneissia japonica TaxID=1529436 RepID=UPI00142569D1|nr:dnaJ homolog subfamily C member 10-like [Anneissia japonica]
MMGWWAMKSKTTTSRVSLLIFVNLLLLLLLFSLVVAEDFYKLLGVERDASERDIRRAFKKIALKHHPDKNKDDPEAHEKFVKYNRAYEVLKDSELREKYDRFGEEGLNEQNQGWRKYESWQFYKTEFGLYDEDPEIVTLSKTDFEQSVFGQDIWIVNFYSPRCHHCHDLAPTWREFAKELEGVVRIGAVNCWDDNPLCTAQGIRQFPTLKMYPVNQEYTGSRKLEALIKHALRQVKSTVHTLFAGNFKDILLSDAHKDRPWVVNYCGSPYGDDRDSSDVSTANCFESVDQLKLSSILNKVVNVATIDCTASNKLCLKLKIEESTIMFYETGRKVGQAKGTELEIDEPKRVAKMVFNMLPGIDSISFEDLQARREKLKNSELVEPMLVYFTKGQDTDDPEPKKLPFFLKGMTVGSFDCGKQVALCSKLYIVGQNFPKAVLFKKGGEYEIHHGRMTAHDVAAFARESADSKLHMLGPEHFPDKVINSGEPWFVDFFSPQCPPCRQLMAELRKVSRDMQHINFGTVDCTVHHAICQQNNVRSYPTTIMFNSSEPHMHVGFSPAKDIIDFIEVCRQYNNFMRNANALLGWAYNFMPSMVVVLDNSNIKDKVIRSQEPWLVDFYASWCGPCMHYMPNYERIARALKGRVNVGKIECQQNEKMCRKASIGAYPTVRLYSGSKVKGNSQNWFGEHLQDISPEGLIPYLEKRFPKLEVNESESAKHSPHTEL